MSDKFTLISEDSKVCEIENTEILPESFLGKAPFVAFEYLNKMGWRPTSDEILVKKPDGKSRVKWEITHVDPRSVSEFISELSRLTRTDIPRPKPRK